ncbi:MAG: S-layer homology domain-containing protein [Oscillospiraceae bacterium]|jgi:hypothetical protein|nr:S-layer homology domain-containing protein [Oscillospiraceae bacterium]
MKQLKQIISTCLAALLLFGLLPAFSASAAFSDISGHWAETQTNGALSRWDAYGVPTSYDGKFYPSALLTRYEMAVMVDRMFKLRMAASSNSFADVNPNDWYAPAIYRVYKAGLMEGDGNFNPENYVTRQQAAVIISRALHIEGLAGDTYFADDAKLPSWSKPFIKRMVQDGVIAGIYRNGSYYYDPTEFISRASFIVMLDNAIDLVANTSANYSGDRAGAVIVNSSGAGLSGMRVQGNVIVSEGVGDGALDLRGVTITGTLFIQGGRRTVNIYDSYIANAVINRAEGEVQIKIGGNSSIDNIEIYTPVILTELSNLSGDGFKRIEIPYDAEQYVRADILGDATELVNYGNGSDLRVTGFVDKLTVNSGCNISGNISYGSLVANTSFTLKGANVNATHTTELSELSLSPSSVNVGGTLAAITSAGESADLRYQWYYAASDTDVNSSAWIEISGARSRTFTPGYEYSGDWLMCRVTGGATTLRAKTSAPVGAVSGAYANCTVEEYSGASNVRSEILVRFVYSAPLYDINGKAILDGYDFRTGPAIFSVKVNTNIESVNDSLIASAIYSTTDNSILVTLAGDASMARNRVEVRPNAKFYTSAGVTIDPVNAPTAIRVAGVSTWQSSSGGLDSTAPTLTIASGGVSGLTLRLNLNEALGYSVNNVIRPMTNMYSLRDLGGATGMFSLTVDKEPVSDANFIQSAYYSATEQAIIIALADIENDSAVTLALLQPLRDIYGNTLLPDKMGVYFRRANETFWYRANTQEEANNSVGNDRMTGEATLTGVKALGNTLTVDVTKLSIQTNLHFTWFRALSKDGSLSEFDEATRIEIGTDSRSYTLTQNDIGKFVYAVVTSTIAPGTAVTSAAEYIGKTVPSVTAKTVTKTQANISTYNPLVINMSELFTITPAPLGRITYATAAAAAGITFDQNTGIAKVTQYGTYLIRVNISEGDNNLAYPGINSVSATLTVNNVSAPRNLVAWATLPEGEGQGLTKFRVLTTTGGNKFYYNPIPVSGSPAQGEQLPLGAKRPAMYSIEFENADEVPLAAVGYYYVVEVNNKDEVVTSGVINVEAASIYAVVLVENKSGVELKSYSYSAKLGDDVDIAYPTNDVIFVPASTRTLYFTAANSKGVDTKKAWTLTYSGLQVRVTINAGVFG